MWFDSGASITTPESCGVPAAAPCMCAVTAQNGTLRRKQRKAGTGFSLVIHLAIRRKARPFRHCEASKTCGNIRFLPSPARPCAATRAGRSSGPRPSRSPNTTSSSSAPAGMDWRPPIISPRSTASPMSRCWKRAGSAAATPAATPPSSAPTTSTTRAPASTITLLKLWDGLRQDLNYNVMYSARGVMMLAHNVHDVQVLKRHVHANRLNGIDNEWLTPEQAKEFCPPLNISKAARYPVVGAALQRRGGTARHDAVAWGYARAASARGVHIIQNCEVTGIKRVGERPCHRRRDDARLHRRQEGRRGRRRPFIGDHADGRRAHAAGELSAAGAGVGAGQAGLPLRGHVQHRSRLYLAVRQGRTGHRRGHRPVHLLFADRRPPHPQPHARRDLRNVPDVHAHEDAALVGRHRRRDAGPLADPGQDPGAGALCQLRLGHGRFQGDAGFGPRLRAHHRQRQSASRSTRRSPSSASAPAA